MKYKVNYRECATFDSLASQPFLLKLKTISQLLEDLQLLKINKIEWRFPWKKELTKFEEVQNLSDLWEKAALGENSGFCSLICHGSTYFFRTGQEIMEVDDTISLEIHPRDSFDITLWLNTFLFLPVYNQTAAYRIDYPDPIFSWELDTAECNRGRVENMLKAIESAANCKMKGSGEIDYGDIFDAVCWQGYNFYIKNRHLEEALDWTYAPKGFNKYEWLAPDECKEIFNREKLKPSIQKIKDLAQSRHLLIREQIELSFLEKIQAADSLAALESLENELNNTPTDPELIKRLLKYTADKKAFY